MLLWFLPAFLVFLMIGMPVFFGLLAAPGILLVLDGQERNLATLYRNVYTGMDSFPLMALPFFFAMFRSRSRFMFARTAIASSTRPIAMQTARTSKITSSRSGKASGSAGTSGEGDGCSGSIVPSCSYLDCVMSRLAAQKLLPAAQILIGAISLPR